jgi:hypothetical protein
MSITVQSRPIKSGCNFNAVGNPLVYKLQRQDSAFHAINDSGGFAQVQINGVDYTPFYEVGDEIYISAYALTATITASAHSGGNTLITVDIPYDGAGTGFINSLSKRTDYRMSVQVYNSADEAIGPLLEYEPFSTGLQIVDVSQLIKSYLSAEWEEITGTNQVESETSLEFYISYAEFYDDAYQAYTDDDANPVIGVFAAMQLLFDPLNLTRYPDGGNLLKFFPADSTKFWLTKFQVASTDKVYMWRGWPFSLSFIWPSTGLATIKRRVVQYDAQGAQVDTDTDTLSVTTAGAIHRLAMPTIHADAARLMVTLLNSSDVAITSTLEVEVKEACSNPIHLFWKNSNGGDSYYQFEFNQEYQDLITQGRRAQRLTLYADGLKTNEWNALNELNSPSDTRIAVITDLAMDDSVNKTHARDDQQVYMLSADGETKIGVIVIPTSNRTYTKQLKHAIEVQIELPEIFVI